MKRILITGASGFAGRHLVEFLRKQDNHEIVGISSRKRPPIEGGRLLVCDLRDADLTRRVLARYRPDVIYHLAGQSHVPRAFSDPADTLVTNAVGQLNLLEGCRAVGIDPVILVVSSAEIYGKVASEDLPIKEIQPLRPNNPYAVSKAAQDLYARQYVESYGMKIVCARPFNHVGPGQSDRFVVSSFARQIAEIEAGIAEPVVLVGNLDPIRDFLDVRDVVQAYVQMSRPEHTGRVFNIASGQGIRIGDVLEMLVRLANRPIDVHVDSERVRPVEVPEFRGDSSQLHEATGWVPTIPFEQTVTDVLNYWRSVVSRRAPYHLS